MNAVMGTERFRHIAVLLASVFILLIGIGAASAAYAADSVEYLDPADHAMKPVPTEDYKVLTNEKAELETGWYVVSGKVSFTDRLIIKGQVDLLLCDEAVLIAPKGIQVTDGNELTIWAQSDGEGMGIIDASAEGNPFIAPIGGGEVSGDEQSQPDAGTTTINGGEIDAACANDSLAAAIGGGYARVIDESQAKYYSMGGHAGEITINGGSVTASSKNASAIGSTKGSWNEGTTGGKVSITGGTVSATGTIGIGSDSLSPDTEIKISGGEIEARSTSAYDSDAISGTLDITGGKVTAVGGKGIDSFPINGHRVDQTKLGKVRVFAGADEDSAVLQKAGVRIDSLRSNKWAKIETCDHTQGKEIKDNGADFLINCCCGEGRTIGKNTAITIDTSGKDTVEEDIPVYYYTGEKRTPAVDAAAGLEEGTDYVVSFYDLTNEKVCDDPVKAGEYKMVISGKGWFENLEGFSLDKEQVFQIRVNAEDKGEITFWKNQNKDDKTYNSISILTGEKPSEKNIPEYSFEGHEFLGWYTDRACSDGKEFHVDQAVSVRDWPNRSCNVYAKWEHKLQAVEEKPATCKESGMRAHSECIVPGCRAFFADAEGKEPVSEEDLVIPVTEHTPGAPVQENVKAATCTEAGEYDLIVRCETCGEIIDKSHETVDALGHNWSEVTYEWAEDNSQVTASRTCRRCDNVDTETAKTTSVTKEPTCESMGKTTYTAVFKNKAFTRQEITDTNIEALGHIWGEWTTKKDATETEAGLMIRTCERNPAHTDTKRIPPIGHQHKLVLKEGKEATCTKRGEKSCYECSSCSCLFEDAAGEVQVTGKDLLIPATGHKRGVPEKSEITQATCSDIGGYNLTTYCTYCGEKLALERVIIPVDPDAHKWGEWISEGAFQHQRVCELDKSHIEKAVHTWDEGKITKEPTEKENGIKTFTCTACGETRTEEISKPDYDRASAKEAADQALAKAKAIKKGSYSDKSYAAVTNAIKALEKVLADDNASTDQIKAATQTLDKAIQALKMNQKLTVKKKTIKVKAKKVKKKAKKVKPLVVKGNKTKVTYKGVGINKKSKKALKINKKTGKITVKKKTKKGTYKMKVTITAAGSAKYEAAKKTVTVKIRVR